MVLGLAPCAVGRDGDKSTPLSAVRASVTCDHCTEVHMW